MPITEAMYRVLYQGGSAREAISLLMGREKKRETEELWIT